MTEAEKNADARRAILGTWRDLIAQGVARENLASIALSISVMEMVEVFGKEAAVSGVGKLSEKIQSGEITAVPEDTQRDIAIEAFAVLRDLLTTDGLQREEVAAIMMQISAAEMIDMFGNDAAAAAVARVGARIKEGRLS
jgi:energy-converting hydrogenase A subunit M